MNENIVLEKEVEGKRIGKKDFRFLGGFSIIYALFYTFCLYKNRSGITSPFFVAGTLLYFGLCMKKLEVSLKKDAWFYIGSALLLGISICLTADVRLHAMSKIGIFILLICFMLHHFYQDEKWGFGKHISACFDAAIATITSIMHPIGDLFENEKEKDAEKRKKRKYICFGIIIAIPLVLIIFFLLISADAIFANLFAEVFELLDKVVWLENLSEIFFLTVFIYFLSYSFIRSLEKRKIVEDTKDKRTKEPIIAITFTSAIAAIYVLFCSVQIAGMFFRERLLPQGKNYAEYAREGFFQLLFLCILNLFIVLMCMSHFKESKALKRILTIISLCTYVMTLSSVGRMLLYIKEYYLTFLRIFVLWSLLVIFLLITGVLITIYKQEFPLFRYGMLIVTSFYIGLAFSHPDYFIAKYNIYAMEQVTEVDDYRYYLYGDWDYLYSLSADATPVLAEQLIEKIEEESRLYYFNKKEEQYKEMTLREWNLSNYIAGKTAEKVLQKRSRDD